MDGWDGWCRVWGLWREGSCGVSVVRLHLDLLGAGVSAGLCVDSSQTPTDPSAQRTHEWIQASKLPGSNMQLPETRRLSGGTASAMRPYDRIFFILSEFIVGIWKRLTRRHLHHRLLSSACSDSNGAAPRLAVWGCRCSHQMPHHSEPTTRQFHRTEPPLKWNPQPTINELSPDFSFFLEAISATTNPKHVCL